MEKSQKYSKNDEKVKFVQQQEEEDQVFRTNELDHLFRECDIEKIDKSQRI